MDDLRGRLSRFFELPEDLLLDLPRITMIGDLQMLIENHRGIARFQPDSVIVETSKGRFAISGRELHIGAIDREAIVITGRISAAHFVDGRG